MQSNDWIANAIHHLLVDFGIRAERGPDAQFTWITIPGDRSIPVFCYQDDQCELVMVAGQAHCPYSAHFCEIVSQIAMDTLPRRIVYRG